MVADVDNSHLGQKRKFNIYHCTLLNQLEPRPVFIETTLVANNNSRRESVLFTIPDEEWGDLIQFLHHVNDLRTTRFVQEGRGGSIGLNWKKGEGLRVSGKQVEEEPVWAMLHKLRPFVLQNEKCFLPKILKALKLRLNHVAFRRHLDRLRDGFSLKLMKQRMPLRGPGRPPLSQQVVMDWLNSYQYHQDAEKRVAVLRDLGPFAESQEGTSTVLFALVDMVQSVLDTGALVETLQRCSEGTMPEVRCPPEYFDEMA